MDLTYLNNMYFYVYEMDLMTDEFRDAVTSTA